MKLSKIIESLYINDTNGHVYSLSGPGDPNIKKLDLDASQFDFGFNHEEILSFLYHAILSNRQSQL